MRDNIVVSSLRQTHLNFINKKTLQSKNSKKTNPGQFGIYSYSSIEKVIEGLGFLKSNATPHSDAHVFLARSRF